MRSLLCICFQLCAFDHHSVTKKTAWTEEQRATTKGTPKARKVEIVGAKVCRGEHCKRDHLRCIKQYQPAANVDNWSCFRCAKNCVKCGSAIDHRDEIRMCGYWRMSGVACNRAKWHLGCVFDGADQAVVAAACPFCHKTL